MEAVLLADFGSTYTKLTAFDLDNEEVLVVSRAPTTVNTDIVEGYNRALDSLEKKLRGIPHCFVEKLACSSAAGGLKIVAVGVERHAGAIEVHFTPTGTLYVQTGKDLRCIKTIIGTGGIIVNGDNPRKILSAALCEEKNSNLLKPVDAELFIDKAYIIPAMGLLAEKYPEKALRILKQNLKKV
jgi:hypothetical protein